MKKLITALLLVSIIFTLAACGNDDKISNDISSAAEDLMNDSANSHTDSNSPENSQNSSDAQSSDTIQNNSNDAKITVDEAKKIALKDAGISENEATFMKAELDRDNGTLKYEIEFKKGNTEYDYDINAQTGEIIWIDKDND